MRKRGNYYELDYDYISIGINIVVCDYYKTILVITSTMYDIVDKNKRDIQEKINS